MRDILMKIGKGLLEWVKNQGDLIIIRKLLNQQILIQRRRLQLFFIMDFFQIASLSPFPIKSSSTAAFTDFQGASYAHKEFTAQNKI